ncbi:efflux RND transporter periplasmic adaptor subunit [Natranaerobius trueperi]|uniref:Uncharacterized protein n=1 Tax=Natranaerobius trueperi TaxID=759412 RepID=A0A226BZF6_9FIRM|nr:efflux RND transporter periplasmic adaptor subunit [Natranaerobius trueperi]OWZ83510.1 hypothetical protein CDO51_08435 [Natranaerobius trueperi]
MTSTKTKKSKKPILIIVITIIVGLIVTSVVAFNDRKGETQSENEEEIHVVEASEPIVQDLNKVTSIIGQVETTDSRYVIPEMSGTVDKVYVSEGDTVTQGKLLFTIDDKEHQYQLQEAQASKRMAKAQLQEAEKGAREGEIAEAESTVNTAEQSKLQAKNEYERAKTLHEEGFVSDQELEQVEMQYKNAKEQLESAKAYLNTIEEGTREEQIDSLEAQVEQAEIGIRMIEDALDRTRVTAPVSGVIANLDINKDDLVGNTEPAIIINAESHQVTGTLSERYINSISEGDKAEVEIPSISNNHFEATISDIGSLPPEEGLSYPVEVLITEKGLDDQLRVGMYSRIRLTVDSSQDALTIPRHALVNDGNNHAVYLVNEDNEIEMKKVEIGISQDGYVEITDGLEKDEQVVVAGLDNVIPGEKVEVQEGDLN